MMWGLEVAREDRVDLGTLGRADRQGALAVPLAMDLLARGSLTVEGAMAQHRGYDLRKRLHGGSLLYSLGCYRCLRGLFLVGSARPAPQVSLRFV